MASAMFKALKASEKESVPLNIVNGDVQVFEQTFDGERTTTMSSGAVPPRVGPRPKFKPVDPSHVFVPPPPEEPAVKYEKLSQNYDLVGDDFGAAPEPAPTRKKPGRAPKYPNSAARQAAYRERKKQS